MFGVTYSGVKAYIRSLVVVYLEDIKLLAGMLVRFLYFTAI